MAVIPGAEQLGSTRATREQRLVSVPRGSVGRAIQQFGQSVQKAGETLQAEQEQRELFETQSQFLDFKNAQSKALVEAGGQSDPGAIGFAAEAAEQYDENARTFFATVPDSQKDRYDVKLREFRNSVSTSADKFELKQTSVFYNSELDRQRNASGLSVRSNPTALQDQMAGLSEAIQSSGLTTAEKRKRSREMQPMLVGQAVLGLSDKGDYAGARALMNKYTGAAKKRGAAVSADSDVVAKIIENESSGDTGAKSATSSATGLGQFIDSTWLETVREHRPELAQGKTDEEILALRTDGDLSREMTAFYAEDNARTLEASGQEPTAGNVYLSHFLGPGAKGGAVAVLSAPDDTPIENILSADKIKANSFLAGKTTGWVKNWAAKKMGSTATIDVGPKWVDGLEKKIAKQETTAATNASTAVKNNYSLSIARDPDNVTEAEIFNNATLQDDDKVTVIKSLRAAKKQTRTLRDAVRSFQVGEAAFNPFDPESRKQVDAFWKDQTDQNVGSKETMAKTRQIVERSGIVPSPVVRAIRSGVNSNNVREVAASAEMADSFQKLKPRSFDGSQGGKEVLTAATDWRHLTDNLGLKPERAAQEMIDARDPDKKRDRAVLDKEAGAIVKGMDAADVSSKVTKGFWTADVGSSNAQQLAFSGDYKELYKMNYRDTGGDEELAEARTVADMQKLYGESAFAGETGMFDSTITKFPAERYYPQVEGSHEYIREQMMADIKQALGKEMPADDVILSADPVQTKSDIDAGVPPRYQLLYRTEEDGIETWKELQAGIYFQADPGTPAAKAAKLREANFERLHLATAGPPQGLATVVEKGKRVVIDPKTNDVMVKSETGDYEASGRKYTPTFQPSGLRDFGAEQEGRVMFDDRMRIEDRIQQEADTRIRIEENYP